MHTPYQCGIIAVAIYRSTALVIISHQCKPEGVGNDLQTEMSKSCSFVLFLYVVALCFSFFLKAPHCGRCGITLKTVDTTAGGR